MAIASTIPMCWTRNSVGNHHRMIFAAEPHALIIAREAVSLPSALR